ncbi:hypothetical protein Pelo_14186 [Pelomyxa schiedti]|nr:hypothetical protein Pelo_14186 [Pelomyxa schiedti]
MTPPGSATARGGGCVGGSSWRLQRRPRPKKHLALYYRSTVFQLEMIADIRGAQPPIPIETQLAMVPPVIRRFPYSGILLIDSAHVHPTCLSLYSLSESFLYILFGTPADIAAITLQATAWSRPNIMIFLTSRFNQQVPDLTQLSLIVGAIITAKPQGIPIFCLTSRNLTAQLYFHVRGAFPDIETMSSLPCIEGVLPGQPTAQVDMANFIQNYVALTTKDTMMIPQHHQTATNASNLP